MYWKRRISSQSPSWLARRHLFGMTLVELMLAVAIVGVLGAIAVPSYQAYVDRVRVAQAVSDIRSIEARITRYEVETRSLPDSLNDLDAGGFTDPWGNPYQYLNLEDKKSRGKSRKDHSLVPINSDYDLYSMGRDGRSVPPLTGQPSRDDVVRGRNGQFVGRASDF